MVVTADQVKASGLAESSAAVLEWRLSGLPLVDPASVPYDLADSGFANTVSAHVGRMHRASGIPNDAPSSSASGLWATALSIPARLARAAFFSRNGASDLVAKRAEAPPPDDASRPASIGRAFTGYSSRYRGSSRYVAPIPEAFASAGFTELSPSVGKKIRDFHDPKIAELNVLLGNGDIRFWEEDGTPRAAIQEETFLRA
jgi:hypothetical protein